MSEIVSFGVILSVILITIVNISITVLNIREKSKYDKERAEDLKMQWRQAQHRLALAKEAEYLTKKVALLRSQKNFLLKN